MLPRLGREREPRDRNDGLDIAVAAIAAVSLMLTAQSIERGEGPLSWVSGPASSIADGFYDVTNQLAESFPSERWYPYR